MNEAISGFSPDFTANEPPSSGSLPFQDDGEWPPSNVKSQPSTTLQLGSAELQTLLAQVQKVGATEIMWFQPDGSSHGFIAFFHNSGNGQILRFEAVAATKAAAVKDVLFQIQQRQR